MTSLFPAPLLDDAQRLIADLRAQGQKLATAESCTGGLIAGLFTEIAGASDVFERGFVTYSNAAKIGDLNVDYDALVKHGAVSAEVARAMAEGAVRGSAATVAVSVTGIAGPGGGTAAKPVGLVYIGTKLKGVPPLAHEHRFGDLPRSEIRLLTVAAALRHLQALIGT